MRVSLEFYFVLGTELSYIEPFSLVNRFEFV